MGDFFLKNSRGGTDKRRLIADDDVEGVQENGGLPHMTPIGYGSVNNNGGKSLRQLVSGSGDIRRGYR